MWECFYTRTTDFGWVTHIHLGVLLGLLTSSALHGLFHMNYTPWAKQGAQNCSKASSQSLGASAGRTLVDLGWSLMAVELNGRQFSNKIFPSLVSSFSVWSSLIYLHCWAALLLCLSSVPFTYGFTFLLLFELGKFLPPSLKRKRSFFSCFLNFCTTAFYAVHIQMVINSVIFGLNVIP